MWRYRNRNTNQTVELEQRSARLDRLPNWELIAQPGPTPTASTGAGGTAAPPDGLPFEPGQHGVDEVNAYLATVDADERDRVLAAEAAGKQRVGVLNGPHSGG